MKFKSSSIETHPLGGLAETFGDARLPDPVLRQEFPEFYTHPRYYDILKQVGLDGEAVAKLVIPPLPF